MPTVKAPTPARIAGIERRLRRDIRWAVDHGPGWNANWGAQWSNGEFIPYRFDEEDPPSRVGELGGLCGVCAVGAACLRRRLMGATEVRAFARAERVPYEWAHELYYAVADQELRLGIPGAAANYIEQLARRLCEYAAACRDARAQRDQRTAERRGWG